MHSNCLTGKSSRLSVIIRHVPGFFSPQSRTKLARLQNPFAQLRGSGVMITCGCIARRLPDVSDTSVAACARDHLARKKLRVSTATHGLARSAHLQPPTTRGHNAGANCRRRQQLVLAASAQQSTTARTPLLHLQERLQDSGATVDALDLSYKQCVATRKLRHGEV